MCTLKHKTHPIFSCGDVTRFKRLTLHSIFVIPIKFKYSNINFLNIGTELLKIKISGMPKERKRKVGVLYSRYRHFKICDVFVVTDQGGSKCFQKVLRDRGNGLKFINPFVERSTLAFW